jgi:hypothetical protein
MNRKLLRLSLRALVLTSLLLLIATSAWAQIAAGTKPIYRIEFKPGEKTALVEETVTQPAGEGDMRDPGTERYTVNALAGQTLSMEITSDTGAALFTLSTPEGEAVAKAIGVKRFSVKLKKSGSYNVTVFTREKPARFKLKVTLR